MFDKFVLTLIIIMLLIGAAMTAVPIPVLWGMGCLIFTVLLVAIRRHQQG